MFVETVGVGQSETAVAGMVDTFLLLTLARTGDSLQGIKKGVLELADVIAVNKADGDRATEAAGAATELAAALHLVAATPHGWDPPVLTCSALEGVGLDEVWDQIAAHRAHLERHGALAEQRREQDVQWLWATIDDHLLGRFRARPAVRRRTPEIEAAVRAGTITAAAARQLLPSPTPPTDAGRLDAAAHGPTLTTLSRQSAVVGEAVDGRLPGVDLVVRPVRLLARELLVVDRLAVDDVEQLGDEHRPRRLAVGLDRRRARPLPGEGEQAADDALLLPGEGAAGAVGDGGEQLVDDAASPGSAVPAHSAASRPAIASPSCLHGVHCPHDSTARNRATPAAAASRSTSSPSTIAPADPSPLPASRIAS